MKTGLVWGGVALVGLLLMGAYVLNLGSVYVPTNGDEMVYLHIARLTHESGAWLPLVSDLQTPSGGVMRNTKPPLLFWQAMWAGQWQWSLFTLRLPYALQTLLCAGAVATLVWALRFGQLQSGQTRLPEALDKTRADQTASWRFDLLLPEAGALHPAVAPLLAAALYLGFFATYRYGRPALSSSTESLFLFALVTFVLMRLDAVLARPLRYGLIAGALVLPALWVKSFVLLAPLGLWWGTLLVFNRKSYGQSALSLAALVLVGLSGFACWFVLDPQPQEVWREFVVGENFSNKFSEQSGDSVLAIWLAPLFNAGLLAPLVLGLCVTAWRERAQMTRSHQALWLWLAAWLVVFTVPQTRSARYVIPVMPVVAVLLAAYAHRIGRVWWVLTLALIGLASLLLLWVVWCLDGVFAVGNGYSIWHFAALGALVLCCALGLIWARWRMACVAAAALVWLVLLGALADPFERDQGAYTQRVQQQLARQTVQVPHNFNASWEKYHFVLPNSNPQPLAQGPSDSLGFVIQTCPLRTPCHVQEQDRVLGRRFVLRSRQNPQEITWHRFITDLPSLLVEQEVLLNAKSTSSHLMRVETAQAPTNQAMTLNHSAQGVSEAKRP